MQILVHVHVYADLYHQQRIALLAKRTVYEIIIWTRIVATANLNTNAVHCLFVIKMATVEYEQCSSTHILDQ